MTGAISGTNLTVTAVGAGATFGAIGTYTVSTLQTAAASPANGARLRRGLLRVHGRLVGLGGGLQCRLDVRRGRDDACGHRVSPGLVLPVWL